MNTITMQAILTILAMAAFIALWVWAWRKQRKPAFDRAAQLPLEEDDVLQHREQPTDNTESGRNDHA